MSPHFIVVFSSDNGGVQPLGVALYSLLSTAALTTSYRVYILSIGITLENRQRLQALASGPMSRHHINFVDVSAVLVGNALPSTERWPVATWARIFIPDLLPEEHGVVLYADIDLLFCCDLAELFHTPLHGKAIGVVLEHVSHEGSHFNERLQIPQTAPGYFNAGVMLMDLDVFRQQELVQRIMKYVEINRERLTCLDQDALNGVLAENLQRLHPKWNWHDGLTRLLLRRRLHSKSVRGSSLQQAVEAALYPGILHFQGPHKPWHYSYRLERQRYEEAMRASGFGVYPLPGRSFKKWLKRGLYAPLYWLTRLQLQRFDRYFRSRQGGE